MATESATHVANFIYLAYIAETALVLNLAYAEFAFERFVDQFTRRAALLSTLLEARPVKGGDNWIKGGLIHKTVKLSLMPAKHAYFASAHNLFSRWKEWSSTRAMLHPMPPNANLKSRLISKVSTCWTWIISFPCAWNYPLFVTDPKGHNGPTEIGKDTDDSGINHLLMAVFYYASIAIAGLWTLQYVVEKTASATPTWFEYAIAAFLGMLAIRCLLPILAAILLLLMQDLLITPRTLETKLTKHEVESVVETRLRAIILPQYLRPIAMPVGEKVAESLRENAAVSSREGDEKSIVTQSQFDLGVDYLAKAKCYSYMLAAFATIVLAIITILYFIDYGAVNELQDAQEQLSTRIRAQLLWAGFYGALTYAVVYPFASFVWAKIVLSYLSQLEQDAAAAFKGMVG